MGLFRKILLTGFYLRMPRIGGGVFNRPKGRDNRNFLEPPLSYEAESDLPWHGRIEKRMAIGRSKIIL